MSSFKDAEKERYAKIKGQLFPAAACAPGTYLKIPRPFCLADGYAAENLHISLRDEAITYFRERHIPWHAGVGDGLPSNHLCCSQSACVNTLWHFRHDGAFLASVFNLFLPELAETLPFDADKDPEKTTDPFLAFEWVDLNNCLGEKGRRPRGANATSADFAFRFRRTDGKVQLVLGEWKYTESYTGQKDANATRHATRLAIYRSAYERWAASQPELPAYESLFVEPFYQLMRLTLLAREIERCGHDGPMQADVVSVVHISPRANWDFAHSFSSPLMKGYGDTVSKAWQAVAPVGRFTPIASEDLLDQIGHVAPPHLAGWRDWLLLRYGWWHGI
jgi:hypothetical protein